MDLGTVPTPTQRLWTKQTWNETREDFTIPSWLPQLSGHEETTATVSLVTRNLFYSTKRVLALPSQTCDMG